MDGCFDESYCHLSSTQTHSQFENLTIKERTFPSRKLAV